MSNDTSDKDNPPDGRNNSASGTKALDRAKIILDYIKVLTWPLLIVCLLIVYRPPIGRLFDSLASKFESADTVKIGSLSLEVQQRAKDLGSPELGRKIGQLSFNAIEALVRTPRTGSMILVSANDHATPTEYGLPSDADLYGLRELEKKGLVTFDEPLDKFISELKSLGKTMPKDSRVRSDDRHWFAVEDRGDNYSQRLRRQGYRLTDAGKKAVEAISKAVAAQLSRP